jgi:hypothetical protein
MLEICIAVKGCRHGLGGSPILLREGGLAPARFGGTLKAAEFRLDTVKHELDGHTLSPTLKRASNIFRSCA